MCQCSISSHVCYFAIQGDHFLPDYHGYQFVGLAVNLSSSCAVASFLYTASLLLVPKMAVTMTPRQIIYCFPWFMRVIMHLMHARDHNRSRKAIKSFLPITLKSSSNSLFVPLSSSVLESNTARTVAWKPSLLQAPQKMCLQYAKLAHCPQQLANVC